MNELNTQLLFINLDSFIKSFNKVQSKQKIKNTNFELDNVGNYFGYSILR